MNNNKTKEQLAVLSQQVKEISQQLNNLYETSRDKQREQIDEAFFRAESLQAYLEFISK